LPKLHRACGLLLATTVCTLGGRAAAAVQAPQAPPAANSGVVRSLKVVGVERVDPETVPSYANLGPGREYSAETLDQALKALYATELFADVVISGADSGNIVITVRENPVINRIVLEGNKRIKDDKIQPEIKLSPRQIYNRSKVRADVDRILELYRRQGRFAASVEPKVVTLDQNRVDLIFEITEGEKSKVRAINIIGNREYSDGRLHKEMFTKQAGGVLDFLKSNNSYDPDRLAADQQKLRAFYLTQGYADFRVVSALAELTPDRKDFIITYVVEEGPRYKFGTVEAESELRDLTSESVKALIRIKPGSWFNAKLVEDAVTGLNEVAGARGYAFVDVSPNFNRDAEKRLMNLTFKVGETPRVYVERINIQGNTVTHDKVIRREFRLNEGDAFNAFKVRRSQDRIQSLGFFQENLEIKQAQGSSNDRVILNLDIEEKSTGQLELSAGYSSEEGIVTSAGISQSNFRGMGQRIGTSIGVSSTTKSAEVSMTEPYLFDKQMLLGGQLYWRKYSSYYTTSDDKNQETYGQNSLGGAIQFGVPLSEYLNFGVRYSLVNTKLTLDKDLYYSDPDGSGPRDLECDPDLAGRTLCGEVGTWLTSSIGYTIAYSDTNSIRPTRGQRLTFSQDIAGLGGDVRYLRTRADATKYWGFGGGFILSAHAEGGYIQPLQEAPGDGQDAIRMTDRFFGSQLRGFDLRGIGPRIERTYYDSEGELDETQTSFEDSLGGRAYYMGRIELELPLSMALRNYGLRPSAFIDIGSVWNLTTPELIDTVGICTPNDGTSDTITLGSGESCPRDYTRTAGYRERLVGNSPSPRLSIGFGVNWVSPFGPLRIDIAKALLKQEGDNTKFFSFNVGTAF